MLSNGFRRIILSSLLPIVCWIVHADEFDSVCRHGPGNTIKCKTQTAEPVTRHFFDDSNRPFSHVFIMDDRKVFLVPAIQGLNCPEMRNHVFTEMMQQSGGSEAVIYQTMLCVTLAGPLYPDGTLSGNYSKYFFDTYETQDEQGRPITLLTIKDNPGWFHCGGPSRQQILAGHYYVGCYKTRQQFAQKGQ